MLRLALLSSVLALPLAAQAADLPVRSAAPAPAPLGFSWQGFYVGGTLGYGAANLNHTHFDDSSSNKTMSTFVGGVHAGYNWQNGSTVYGVEADVASFRARGHFAEQGSPTPSTTAFRSNVMATLRGRVGIAFDRTLVYGTAGVSYTSAKLTSDGEFDGADSYGFNKFGFVLGAGVEHAITNNWIVRAEGLYNIVSSGHTFDDGGENVKLKNSFVLRAGLSYKF